MTSKQQTNQNTCGQSRVSPKAAKMKRGHLSSHPGGNDLSCWSAVKPQLSRTTTKNYGGMIKLFHKAWNYCIAKALQDQYQSNRLGNAMCPFQLDGVECGTYRLNWEITERAFGCCMTKGSIIGKADVGRRSWYLTLKKWRFGNDGQVEKNTRKPVY